MTKNTTSGGLCLAKLASSALAQMKTHTCYDPKGVSIELCEKDEKASGGEGTVYTVPGKPNVLVKIYHADILSKPDKGDAIRARIEAMARDDRVRNLPNLAWPLMPVYGTADCRQLIGFAMRCCKGVPLQSIFAGPDSVRRKFPQWTRRELAEMARNYVRCVRELSERGILVTDFNPANVLCDVDRTVSFIDVDSFQVADAKGRMLISHTHFPSHAAPELLNDPGALNRPRTLNQTSFSAALVAFQILMCGYHPYSYRDAVDGRGCGSPEENLRAGRCPLGAGADCRFPNAWYRLWSYLSRSVKGVFIDTFKDGHGNPARRATLNSLEYALNGLLITMARDEDANRVSLRPDRVKPRPPMPPAGYPCRSPVVYGRSGHPAIPVQF